MTDSFMFYVLSHGNRESVGRLSPDGPFATPPQLHRRTGAAEDRHWGMGEAGCGYFIEKVTEVTNIPIWWKVPGPLIGSAVRWSMNHLLLRQNVIPAGSIRQRVKKQEEDSP
jgi:hypothetical protein